MEELMRPRMTAQRGAAAMKKREEAVEVGGLQREQQEAKAVQRRLMTGWTYPWIFSLGSSNLQGNQISAFRSELLEQNARNNTANCCACCFKVDCDGMCSRDACQGANVKTLVGWGDEPG
jgi:hypothetical protein